MIGNTTYVAGRIDDPGRERVEGRARWRALFRGAALARRPALVRRLHGPDTPEPGRDGRLRTACRVCGRHAMRLGHFTGRKPDRPDNVQEAAAEICGRPTFALCRSFPDRSRYDR